MTKNYVSGVMVKQKTEKCGAGVMGGFNGSGYCELSKGHRGNHETKYRDGNGTIYGGFLWKKSIIEQIQELL